MSVPEPGATPAPEKTSAAASRSPRHRGRGDDLAVYSLLAVLALIAAGYGLAKWAGLL